ncbi:unnamed protein product [Lymnaea stagnalis]|uniref:Nucleoside diphosphate kinase-like domain-containing protein n=1 Tax=Lymnaea stagnalis TaxID=6523 RepID=A0AAV2I5H2_LYMST
MNSRPLQLTLALLKPDVVAHPHILHNVRQMMLENGFYLLMSKQHRLSTAQTEQFYTEHRGTFFQNRLVTL